ncbi:uncharacterized protein LOC116205453 isoform X5 [Punica granatum]|uniref:Uncharacterized protein LOC116205453 isoform X5 n=1 Tax=Punica granatum TaxID=22663 RepID=A0A6P8DBE6_PUNGR|nr:uncharacterized protein LOC116205453 isoform X5 [Punica granatum]
MRQRGSSSGLSLNSLKMADQAPTSSSSAALEFGTEGDEDFIFGAASGWVEARTSCDHLASLSPDLLHIPDPDTPCNRCHHPGENWLCLCCKEVLCSRYVNKHMLQHYQQSDHSLALGFRDLSVWCYACNAYLDTQVISQLRGVHEAAYTLKIGKHSTFSTVPGQVEIRTSCDHLASLSPDLLHIPAPDTPCNRCHHPGENWLCLCCKEVLCSRYVNKHMLQHYQQSDHSLALGFRDLSVWCYACNAYLDAQVISQLRGVHEASYTLKIGKHSTFSTVPGQVEIRTSCDHLASLSPDLLHIPAPDTPCNRCHHPGENWLCLCCKEVLCSRYVNKHMLQHYQQSDHSLALGFRDLSVWCYACNAYLDAQAISQLRGVHEAAYTLKIGKHSTFSTVPGQVEIRTSCDHLASLSPDLLHIPAPDTPCNRCHHPGENWLCLCCKEVLCSRYVNKHMLQHYQQSDHSLALGFRDLSVWCYACNAYLDAQVISQLRGVHEAAYTLKIGKHSTFSTVPGQVEIRTSCDHLASLSPDLLHIPAPDTPCNRCHHPGENWLCLCCKEVLCSRYVNKHMLQHYQQSDHSLALGFRDLSVWCYACNAYLDAQVISQLRGVHEAAYTLKIGKHSTFSTVPGQVEIRTSCDHLASLSPDLLHIPAPDTPCNRCHHPGENWLCLCCKEVLCSRYVNKHMLQHYQQSDHSLALGFRDLSVWCYACNAYLDAQVISQLRGVHEAAYTLKIGKHSTFSTVPGQVEIRTSCDHLASLSPDLLHIPAPDTPCNRCHHPGENWLCLCCKEVLCSRYVNKHMLQHYQQSDHSLALGFRDLSVWCYACNAYLDAQVISQLRGVHEAAYTLKIGKHSTFSTVPGQVEIRTSCDHLASLSPDLLHIPAPDTPCNRCHHPGENWLCLCCKEVLCSRYVNKHMLQHYQHSDHSLALGFRDLSVWCYACNAYLDAQVISQLRGVHEAAYTLKIGKHSTFSTVPGQVEIRTSCDHLASLSPDLLHIPAPDTPCNRCHHPCENWLCLCCKEVLCSRYVNKHMLQHYQQSDHSLALGFRDLSVWCYACNAYLDAQVISQLRGVHEAAYTLKIGKHSTFSTVPGQVEIRTSCDHLASLSPDLLHIPAPDTPCNRCHHPGENWLCLFCKEVLCSRYVNKHMLQHFQQSDHSLALGFRDLSVWCYACNAYLDAQVILQLRGVHEAAYTLKIGKHSTFSTVPGQVEIRTSCDHLASLSPDLLHIPAPDTPCNRCHHPGENWLCLCCKEVLCSRYVNKHMLQHYQRSTHPLALGFRYMLKFLDDG